MPIDDTLAAFVDDPTQDHLRELREAVMADPAYDPLVRLRERLEGAESPEGVVEVISAGMPGLLLSPLAHGRLALAQHQLGDEQASGRERLLARLAVASIRQGGTGEEGSPFPVLRVEDEYDLLGMDGLRRVSQREERREGRVLDVLTTADGREVWFDLLWRS